MAEPASAADASRLLDPDKQHSEGAEPEDKEEQPERWDVLEECRLDSDRPPSGSYGRIVDLIDRKWAMLLSDIGRGLAILAVLSLFTAVRLQPWLI